MTRSLVVKITCGKEAAERCNQGFTVAAAALAAGADVTVWLTGEAVWFAVPGHAEDFTLPHAAPLRDLLGAIISGGAVRVCGQCAARRDLDEHHLVEGITISGAASFAEQVLRDGVQALVY